MGHLLRAFLLVALATLPVISCKPESRRITIIDTTPDPMVEASQLYREVVAPVVLVEAPDGGTGSAVAIGPRLFLTARHVVTPSEADTPFDSVAIMKSYGNGESLFLTSAKVIKEDKEKDLALLSTEVDFPASAQLAEDRDVFWGVEIWISGHPMGVTDPKVTKGVIDDLEDEGRYGYTAGSTFGNSGGPVFLKSGGHYKVVSICQLIYVSRGGPVFHMGLGAKIGTIRNFLGL